MPRTSTTEWVNDYSVDPADARLRRPRGAAPGLADLARRQSLNKASDSATERRFLLDWYAVKWVDADTGSGDLSQYDDDPASFVPLKAWVFPGGRMQTYRFEQAAPILSASSAPTVLVIGDDQHYDLVLRSLALSGLDSERLVLVHGPASLDDVTPALLASFPSVALYGATIDSPARDARILGDYVHAGGGLFVDGAENSAQVGQLVGQPGSPLPVTSAKMGEVPDTGWDWTSYGNPTVVPADLSQFGPPAYATSGGWETQHAVALTRWATPVLAAHGNVVAATGSYGAGRVVWEGLNLPYHVASYRSEPEAAFFGRALLSTTTAAPAPTRSDARFVNAQSWSLQADGARGVLLKEQWAPGWQVSVNGHSAQAYPAGPGMIWIPLQGQTGPVSVTMNFRLSSVDRLGYAISVGTLLGLVLLLSSGRLRRRFRGGVDTVLTGPVVRVPAQRAAIPDGSRRVTPEPLPTDFGLAGG